MSQARDLGDAANKANFLDNVTSDIQAQLTSLIFPEGTIITFGGTSAPTGYLACDGSAVSRTTFATLFTAIGTTWGSGDGASTFNVPDLRGAFLRGTGSHGTSNMANGSDFAGPAVGSFEADQMQDHRHDLEGFSQGSIGTGNANVLFGSESGGATSSNAGGVNELLERNSQGTPRVGDETRPFNAGILYCIKT